MKPPSYGGGRGSVSSHAARLCLLAKLGVVEPPQAVLWDPGLIPHGTSVHCSHGYFVTVRCQSTYASCVTSQRFVKSTSCFLFGLRPGKLL
jgi:hypothetical protein